MDYRGININDEVLIKLTPHGKRILKRRNNALRKFHYDTMQDISDDFPFKSESDGWSQCPLWVIMQIFGEHMGNGFDLPLETTIRIVQKG